MNHAFKISLASIALLASVVSCSKDSSPASAPVPPAAIVAPLSTMPHRFEECPDLSELQGRWVSRGLNGQHSSPKTFRLEPGRVIETTSSGDMIYDGMLHDIPVNPGARATYVGACERGKIKMTLWVGTPTSSVYTRYSMSLRGDALVIRTSVGNQAGNSSYNQFEVFERPRQMRRRY